jgi:integrase
MAWVEQVGTRSWRVRFPNEDGGVTSIGGLPTREVAVEYAATLEIQQRQGQWIDPVAGRMPVAEWVGQWWPTVDVAERTEDNYRSNLRNHVLPRWGDRRLCDISTGEIHAWTRDLRAAGYAPSTVSSQIKLLSMILADAVDARLITINPVRRRRRGRRVVSPLNERVWADPDHVVAVTGQATVLGGSTFGLLIVTAAWTGARWGELTGLQRANTHLDDGVIVIDPVIGALHESGSRLWLGPPKTAASVRTITLPPFLITLLREHLQSSDETAVFPGPRGGWLRRSNVYRRALRPAADGNLHIAHPRIRTVPIRPGLTFHGLRHSHKTWLIDDGMPEIAQSRRLGHHLPNRVVETYSHVAADLNQRLLDGLERRWHGAQCAAVAAQTSVAEDVTTLTSGWTAA